MRRPACQLPDQECIDRTKQQLSRLGPIPRTVHIVEDPFQLGPRKIGVQQQPRPGREHLLVSGLFQRGTRFRCPPVLPDNGVVDLLAGVLLPNHHCLALIGDADPGNAVGADARLFDGRPADRGGRRPQIRRIMLDPTGRRIMLRKLLLSRSHNLHLPVEQNSPAGCGALVDGHNMGHWVPPLMFEQRVPHARAGSTPVGR